MTFLRYGLFCFLEKGVPLMLRIVFLFCQISIILTQSLSLVRPEVAATPLTVSACLSVFSVFPLAFFIGVLSIHGDEYRGGPSIAITGLSIFAVFPIIALARSPYDPAPERDSLMIAMIVLSLLNLGIAFFFLCKRTYQNGSGPDNGPRKRRSPAVSFCLCSEHNLDNGVR